jgi:tRNA(Ile)-lysidine synthase
MADDSAETLLLNLLRGSGLTGLSGIPKVRTFVKNVRLIRPLIELRKADLIAYAKERRLIWREDKSNQLLDYTRNKVRHSLIPMLEQNFNPNIIDTLTRTAKLISGADEFVSDMVTNSLEYVTDDVRQERFAVKVNLMQTFPEFVQGEIIQKLVNKYFRIANLPMRKIADIIELMNHQTGAVYQINKNYQVLSDRKRLIFTKVEDYIKISERFSIEQGFENAEISLKVTPVRKKDIKFNDNPNEEYLDKSKISRTLKIRNKEEGDCFIPLGMLGRVKVSDFLTNEKVSLIDKSKVLVLESGGEIVWVVGHRVSEKFKVDAQTQEAYKIEFSIKNGHKNEQKTDGLE